MTNRSLTWQKYKSSNTSNIKIVDAREIMKKNCLKILFRCSYLLHFILIFLKQNIVLHESFWASQAFLMSHIIAQPLIVLVPFSGLHYASHH